MFTEHDNRKGLVKTNWQGVRERVHKVNSELANLIDEVSPGDQMPLFLAYYRYGDKKGDTISSILPAIDNKNYRLTESEAPKEIFKHLGYGTNAAPLTLLLEKNFEFFVDLPEKKLTIPVQVYKPGSLFPLATILRINKARNYPPNGVLQATAGCRSVFMLPNIGRQNKHHNLQRDFNLKTRTPKFLYEHFNVFKELAQNPLLESDWRGCLLYFSESWVDNMLNNPAWHKIKLFIYQYGWQATEFKRNKFYYDFILSSTQEKTNFKLNPYLFDTAKHLFKIALGESIGFSPATTEDALPLTLLQNVFINSYAIENYTPTIMKPNYFTYEEKPEPIYYSLQHPTIEDYSKKSIKVNTALVELKEISRIARLLQNKLSEKNGIFCDTIMYKISKGVTFDYYHNKPDPEKILQLSPEMAKHDERFNYTPKLKPNLTFSSDAKFVRGCLKISTLKNCNFI